MASPKSTKRNSPAKRGDVATQLQEKGINTGPELPIHDLEARGKDRVQPVVAGPSEQTSRTNNGIGIRGPPGADARLLCSFESARKRLDLSRSTIYQLIATGRLEAVKYGVKTMLVEASIQRFVAGLPPASFRVAAPKSAAAA